MFLNEFNQSPNRKINKLNKLLESEFGVSVKSFPSKQKLEKLAETANNMIVSLRNSNKKFQLEPDYAKFLGIKDVVETMINEGMYAESPKYMEMKHMIEQSVQELMDSGYTMEEACTECMNRFRMDNRFAYDDDHVKPMVVMAAKSYMEACSSGMKEEINSDLNEYLLAELAKECGVEVSLEGLTAIEEKLSGFAQASGKSRDAVVSFLNGLEEASVQGGIQMFGRKIAEANKFVKARKDAVASGKDEFEVDGKKYKVTGDTSQEELEETEVEESTMFDDIVSEMINEEVDVEQAEVVMAVRALADDVQGHIEEIGRMMNETVPAIADQMRAEMGASQAQGFVDATSQLLNSYLESAKGAKSSMDTQVSQLTGEEQVGGLGDTAELGAPAADADDLGLGDDLGDETPADNIPAAAGPLDAPLGRAEI